MSRIQRFAINQLNLKTKKKKAKMTANTSYRASVCFSHVQRSSVTTMKSSGQYVLKFLLSHPLFIVKYVEGIFNWMCFSFYEPKARKLS